MLIESEIVAHVRIIPLLLSIIIPCYNEEEVIAETVKRLKELADGLSGWKVEYIFVDDGSRDCTRELLENFATTDTRIKIIGLARNFGHQIAITAGMDATTGDAVVLIDADLQDPPEVISQMIAKWSEGYDVVYGTRIERSGESSFKLTTAKAFYYLLNYLSDIPVPLDTGDFRLMSRRVVEALRSMPERARFVRGMVSWVGFKQIALPYRRSERFAGKSKYPLRKMLRFATDGIISFSTKPLQMSIGLGVLAASMALAGIFYSFCVRIFTHNWVEGWTTLMIAILFLGGVQLICMGILGEYIGRIYRETQKRPLYIIQEYIGFASKEPSHPDPT